MSAYSAADQMYPQCWLNIHCIGPVSYRNVALVGNNIRNKITFRKKQKNSVKTPTHMSVCPAMLHIGTRQAATQVPPTVANPWRKSGPAKPRAPETSRSSACSRLQYYGCWDERLNETSVSASRNKIRRNENFQCKWFRRKGVKLSKFDWGCIITSL